MDRHAERRERLMERMGPGIAILFGADTALRNGDVHHEFRQDSDFYYLTGFEEPGAVAVLTPYRADARYTLFVLPRDPEREAWDGPRAGVEDAVALHGADAAFPADKLDAELERLIDGAQTLFYSPGRPGAASSRDAAIFRAMHLHRAKPRDARIGPDTLVELSSVLDEMRWVKSPDELDTMRRACRITALAHREAMRAARPGLHEYHVQAIVEYIFRSHGSARNGYGSIVASGPNATTLHHVSNRRQLQAGELLLIDAGCEVDYYTADITRTFPVNGRFSAAQRDVYSIVLEAQRAALAKAVPGETVLGVHRAALRVLTQGMVDLKLLEGDIDGLIEREAYKPYYMHRTSHWLGMDVHDVGRYVADREQNPMVAGTVITIEPGLYIRADCEAAPEALRGIGVRIEDDVLLAADAPVVLTGSVPTAIEDVEALCQEPSRFAELLPRPA